MTGAVLHARRGTAWRLKSLALGLVLLIVALVARYTSLGAFAWPDEQTWIERSAAFITAIERGDLAGTYLTDHPGVVPMWGFGTALAIQASTTGTQDTLDALAAGEYEGDYPALLSTAATFTVLLTSLTVAVAFFLLIPLLGRAGATLAGLLLALDPFYLTHSRIVHVDAILASAMLLSTLSLLVYLKRASARTSLRGASVASDEAIPKGHPDRSSLVQRSDPHPIPYLLLSGFAAGLALLTKTPSLFLIPLTALVLGWQWLRHRRGRDDWGKIGQLAGAFGIWIAAAWGTFFLLWPATWSNPFFFLWRLYRASRWATLIPHGSSSFFLGRVVEDPGPLFYLVVFPFRLSPLVLLLLPVGLVLAIVAWRRGRDVRVPFAMYAFVVFFTIMVSLAAKKGDRYLLPVYPLADVAAAWAAMALLRTLVPPTAPDAPPTRRWLSRRTGYIALVALLLLSSLLWLPLAPHYGAYFDPLVGGGPVAARTFAFGQGEGLEMAAEYLNSRNEAGDLLVVSFYPPQFRYYFHGDATSLRRGDWDGTWQFADYVVFYISQVQRQLPTPELVEFFQNQEPEYVAEIGGVDFARVYRSPVLLSGQAPWAEHMIANRVVDDRLSLTTYAISELIPAPGDTWYVTLGWQAIEQLGRAYAFEALLVDDAGQIAWQQAGPPFEDQFPTWWWKPGRILYLRYRVPLPAGLPPGEYRLLTRVYDPDSGETLPPTDREAAGWPGYLDVIEIQIAP